MKYIQKIILGILFLCLTIATSGCIQTESIGDEQQEYVQGNTNGNILNGGYLIEKDGWVYYTNFNDHSSIYKKKTDGSQITEITQGHYGYELNLVSDWIYYISGAPGEVFKVDINGEKDSRLINKKVENLIVTNEHMFYRLAFDHDWGKLYKADLNGRNKKLLAKSAIKFVIEDGWIYYINGEDNGGLYKMDFDGNNITKLNNEYASDISIEGDYVYYTDTKDGSLYRIKNDGNEKMLLSSEDCRGINVKNNYIYYRNQTQRGRIYRMKLDGSENKVIIDMENCVGINVTDDFLIYRIPQSNGGYFKANLDGSNIEKWTDT